MAREMRLDCRMLSIVGESTWQRSKCRRAQRHMMSNQFEVDNKRNSATPRTNCPGAFATVTSTLYREMSMQKRRNGKRAWSSIRICRTADFQMRSMTISFPIVASAFIEMRDSNSSLEEWRGVINLLFSPTRAATLLAQTSHLFTPALRNMSLTDYWTVTCVTFDRGALVSFFPSFYYLRANVQFVRINYRKRSSLCLLQINKLSELHLNKYRNCDPMHIRSS